METITKLNLILAILIGGVAMTNKTEVKKAVIEVANNFYKSDKVDVKKVSFKNQYNMKIVGNLFIPKNLDKNQKVLP